MTAKMNVAGFDWDFGNSAKAQKHGLSIDEIEGFFSGNIFVKHDLAHSQTEKRFIAVGTSQVTKKPMFVSFTLRKLFDQLVIRVISARYMHKKESELYTKIFETNQGKE